LKLIDIQLVVTHIIAFLIVLWLLRRFAWGPVLKMLDARRERISGELDEAAARRAEAEAMCGDYEERLRGIEVEGRDRLRQAVLEGNAAAARIRERAEEERRQRLERTGEELRLLEESASETLRRRTVDLALRAAEKAVASALDETAHRSLIERCIREIEVAGDRGAAS